MAVTSSAQDGEYAIRNENWNGLSQFVALARAAGVTVQAPERLEMSALQPSDGLLVVFPGSVLPRVDLAAFMAAGGRLAIADDFGSGSAVLSGYGIGRSAPVAVPRERRLRGNTNVLIAKPDARHPLSAGVSALVTNHPQVLHHESLEAIFSLDAQRSAVVLSGGVGQGRLVALGDPSVLINNMLEFRGNQAFARNLIRYLAPHGRLWILAPSARITGHYGASEGSDPLAIVRQGLQRISQVRLPPAAVRATTALIAAALLFAAATALPRRAAYARAVSLPAQETIAGFAGRVRFFERRQRDLTAPTLVYRLEFERRLLQALGLPGQPALREIQQALERAGLAVERVAEARDLLIEFERVALARDRPGPGAEPVPAQKFRAIVAAGDRILAALDARADRSGSRSS
jgi:hypothetical protein